MRGGRWANIAFRTLHLLAFGILLGGHAFDVPAHVLYLWLVLTVLSGAGLVGLELYQTGHWLFMAEGNLVLLKVILTALAGVWWDHRLAILAVVVVIGSIGSHMPGQYRHYSFLHGRELTYPKS